MSKKRCHYCGKSITNDEDYCNIKCKKKYDKFKSYASKRKGLFKITIDAMIIMFFIGLILATVYTQVGVIVISLAIGGFFLTIIMFPFVSPEIVKSLGIKKSVLLVRSLVLIIVLWVIIFIKII